MRTAKTLLLTLVVGFALTAAYAQDVTLFKKYPYKGWYGSGWNGAKVKIVTEPTPEKEVKSMELSCSEKVKPYAGCVFRTKRDSSILSIPGESLNKAFLTFKVYIKKDEGQDVTIQLLDGSKKDKYPTKVMLSDFTDLKKALNNWVEVSIPLIKFSDKVTGISGIMFRFNRKPAPIFLSLIKIEYKSSDKEESKQ